MNNTMRSHSDEHTHTTEDNNDFVDPVDKEIESELEDKV